MSGSERVPAGFDRQGNSGDQNNLETDQQSAAPKPGDIPSAFWRHLVEQQDTRTASSSTQLSAQREMTSDEFNQLVNDVNKEMYGENPSDRYSPGAEIDALVDETLKDLFAHGENLGVPNTGTGHDNSWPPQLASSDGSRKRPYDGTGESQAARNDAPQSGPSAAAPSGAAQITGQHPQPQNSPITDEMRDAPIAEKGQANTPARQAYLNIVRVKHPQGGYSLTERGWEEGKRLHDARKSNRYIGKKFQVSHSVFDNVWPSTVNHDSAAKKLLVFDKIARGIPISDKAAREIPGNETVRENTVHDWLTKLGYRKSMGTTQKFLRDQGYGTKTVMLPGSLASAGTNVASGSTAVTGPSAPAVPLQTIITSDPYFRQSETPPQPSVYRPWQRTAASWERTGEQQGPPQQRPVDNAERGEQSSAAHAAAGTSRDNSIYVQGSPAPSEGGPSRPQSSYWKFGDPSSHTEATPSTNNPRPESPHTQTARPRTPRP
jgi:hypothetical protein